MANDVHNAVQPLSWLIGRWIGLRGKGVFPTIKSFEYDEEIEFSHPASHQPVLHLKYTSWLLKGNDEKSIAHCEYGFLKVIPNSSPPKLVYSGTQNTCLATIEEGIYDESSKTLCLESKSIERSSFNKPPVVQSMKRVIQLKDGNLKSNFYMSTSTTPDLQEHLHIIYSKV